VLRLPFTRARRAALLATSLVAAGLAILAAHATAEDLPAWLAQAKALPTPGDVGKARSVVLLRERSITIGETGRVQTVNRVALRVLTLEGRDDARDEVVYLTDTGKVRDLKAWIIRPSGAVLRYGGGDAVDAALALDDVYNEVRWRGFDVRRDAEPGAVFGFESVADDASLFTQFDWYFQYDLPTMTSRFSLTLPEGWQARAVTFNHAPVEPAVLGATRTWELHGLPWLEDEPASPPLSSLVPRLGVSCLPPPGRTALPVFDTWPAVAGWLDRLSAPSAGTTPSLETRARGLVTRARSETDSVRAIAQYVQNVRYASIQLGLGRGGGYKPHPAGDVLEKSYGDCKDKANLMRTMLGAVGIPACLVSVYYGDPDYVREEWPTPQQFNHCIVGLRLRHPPADGPIVSDGSGGRLMLFDPTDPNTSVGDLPALEQGSYVLPIRAGAALARVPQLAVERDRLERSVDLALAPDGGVVGSIRERSVGQAASRERQAYRSRSVTEYRRLIEAWVAQGASGAAIESVGTVADSSGGRFALDVRFRAPRYGQVMQNRLLTFRPAMVSRSRLPELTEEERKTPVVLTASAFAESVIVRIPEGFAVDEIPDPVKIDETFGRYVSACAAQGDRLVYTRSLAIPAARVPTDRYAAVRAFCQRVRAAEEAPVVLARP